jgi:hypothetical protein
MYLGRLTRIDPSDLDAISAADDDPPPTRWPRPTIRRLESEGRTVLQMQVPHELLAELDASDEVEFHIVPEDADG